MQEFGFFMTNYPTGSQFLNRELGQIEFNRRVLAQAANKDIPLLERLKFLCIVSSNLDEFFEIRVAGLKEQINLDTPGFGPDGMLPHQVFKRVFEQAHALVALQYQLLNQEVLPGLASEGIRFLRRSAWSDVQREWIKAFFFRELMPVLTPIGLDIAHPFPRVLNKSLNFAVELEGKDAFGRSSGTAIVQAPRVLPRVILLPGEISDSPYNFVFLSSILHAHVGELFSGMNVLGCYQFRATRNSELFVDEEEVKNLRIALQGELPQRHLGNAVRLEVADNCPKHMSDFLLEQLGLSHDDFYQVEGPVNLVRLMHVPDLIGRPDLKYPAVHSRSAANPPKEKSRRYLSDDPQERHSAASSVSVIPAGNSFHPAGGDGSRRGSDQTDRIPYRNRFLGHGSAYSGSGQRQGSNGGGGVAGTFR